MEQTFLRSVDKQDSESIVAEKRAAARRVLLVEDDPYMSLFIYEILQCINPEIRVDHFYSAEKAVQRLVARGKINRNPYSFIISDIYLSDKETGLDLWRYCQQNFPDIPVIVTSIMSSCDFRDTLRHEKSIPQYLPKPFSIKECMNFFSAFTSEHPMTEAS